MPPLILSARRAGWAAGYHAVKAYDRWVATRDPQLHATANVLYAAFEDLYQDRVDASGVRTVARRAA